MEIPLRPICLVLALLAIVAGAAGMALSFLYMSTSHPLNVESGAAGFVAGSVLIGAGLVSLTQLATTSRESTPPKL